MHRSADGRGEGAAARGRRGVLLAVLAGMLLASPGARAKNPTVNANFFRPAVHPGSLLGVETTLMADPMDWGVGAFFTWSHKTVRLEDQSGADVYQVVRDLVAADVYGHFAPTRWLDIGLDVPVFLWSAGDSPPGYLPLQSATGASLSDLRLGLKFRALGGNDDGFGLAFTEDLTFPTATDDDLGGDRYVTSTTLVVGGFSKAGWNVALDLGVRLKAPVAFLGVETSHQLLAGLGLAAPILRGRLEAIGTAELRTRLLAPFQSSQHDALDLLAGLRGRLGPVWLTLAGGAGVLGGYGTPLGRVTLGVSYVPPAGDGRVGPPVAKRVEAKPEDALAVKAKPAPVAEKKPAPVAEKKPAPAPVVEAKPAPAPVVEAKPAPAPVVEAAPVPRPAPLPRVVVLTPGDRDGDGVPDGQDACPDVAGVPGPDPRRNGCPPDRDGDGVIDALDMCPDVFGTALADHAHLGCPPDRDGDGVMDPLDACPDEPGVASIDDPTRSGCPVRSTVTRAVIVQVVEFDSDSLRLRDDALPVLVAVARLLRERPNLSKVEVAGHSDSSQSPSHSYWLSEQRAAVVREFLVRQGVAPQRLVAHGYGDLRPVADNTTEVGRRHNRRVEFKVLEQE
jgi:OmpA-OmpF porin, OOP family